jgi:hypothetical protein
MPLDVETARQLLLSLLEPHNGGRCDTTITAYFGNKLIKIFTSPALIHTPL